MTRRFVVLAEPLTAEQAKELHVFLHRYGGWWHWIQNVWLLATESDAITTDAIIDEIRRLNPTARAVAFEFPEEIDWTATGTANAGGKKIHDWLITVWEGKKP